VTAERYTAVFTGLLSLKKPGEYPYLSMSGEPLVSGASSLHRGQPPYRRMGCEISFENLPEDRKRLVLGVYRDLWGLQDAERAA
jgi:hypothetical protein